MQICPQCGATSPDDAWNCVDCRVNLYWAHQHHAELSHLRQQQGLATQASTPPFLISSSHRELEERTKRGLNIENKVRTIARRVMRGTAPSEPAADS
jgi:hypothetical protein